MTEAELADWYGPAAQPARVAEGRARYGKSPARGKRTRRS
jgi:hypothetical protein